MIPGSVRAQAVRVIRGRVTDPAQTPIAGVTVQLAGSASAVTDDAGRFTIHTDTGAIIFDIHRIGFRATRYGVRAGRDTTVNVILLPSAQSLDPVDVTAKEADLTGFAQRMQANKTGAVRGVFITADDIEKRQPRVISSMFDDVAGVTVDQYMPGRYVLLGNHLLYAGKDVGMARCLATVYIDGARIGSGRRTLLDRVPGSEIDNIPSKRIERNGESMEIDALVDPTDVLGMEYYDEPHNAPAKYQTAGSGCGVLLIWTKHGDEQRKP